MKFTLTYVPNAWDTMINRSVNYSVQLIVFRLIRIMQKAMMT